MSHSKRLPETPPEAPAAQDSTRSGISRRGFLKGAGFTAAGTALLDGVHGFASESNASSSEIKEYGPGPVSIRLQVNGAEHTLEIEPRTTLAEALRDHL